MPAVDFVFYANVYKLFMLHFNVDVFRVFQINYKLQKKLGVIVQPNTKVAITTLLLA